MKTINEVVKKGMIDFIVTENMGLKRVKRRSKSPKLNPHRWHKAMMINQA